MLKYVHMQNIKSKLSTPKAIRLIKIVLIIIIIFTCLLSGYAAGRGYKTYEINLDKNLNKNNQTKIDHTSMGNAHNQKEIVSPKVYAPKLTINPLKDTMGSYNVQILTNNFKFTPENVGKEVVQNTGHAHVYVNNIKVGRAYGEWFNIPDSYFTSGTNTISVTLNANNHNVWWSRKGTLEARASADILK